MTNDKIMPYKGKLVDEIGDKELKWIWNREACAVCLSVDGKLIEVDRLIEFLKPYGFSYVQNKSFLQTVE